MSSDVLSGGMWTSTRKYDKLKYQSCIFHRLRKEVKMNQKIKECIIELSTEYPFKRVVLFGSRASGNHRQDSDVDLIVEFSEPVSLMVLSSLKIRLEEMLGLDVDVIHGPIRETDMIEVEQAVELYAA